jgi:hypothetical protein
MWKKVKSSIMAALVSFIVIFSFTAVTANNADADQVSTKPRIQTEKTQSAPIIPTDRVLEVGSGIFIVFLIAKQYATWRVRHQ